jgi:hypothetical protein
MGGNVPVNAALDSVNGIQIGTSCYGKVIPIVYGTARLAGNIIWMPKDFWSKEGSDSGPGKGGGSSGSQVQYYQGVMIAICEGGTPSSPNQISIGRVWEDKNYYSTLSNVQNGAFYFLNGARPQSIWSFLTTPISGTKTVMAQIIGNSLVYSDPYLTSLRSNQVWLPALMSDVWYPIPNQHWSYVITSGVGITFTFDSSSWNTDFVQFTYNSTNLYPQNAIAYSGTAIVAAQKLSLGSSNSMKNYTFEVKGFFSNGVDANPADIIYDLLTNTVYGCGWNPGPQTDLGQNNLATSSYRTYCTAMNFKLSPIFDTQKPVLEHVQEILDATNSEMVWSDGRLKIIPLGDTQIGSYIPNITPLFDLIQDDFSPLSSDSGKVETSDDGPITISRVKQSETFNQWPIEYIERTATDQSNAYNVNVANHVEQADIERTNSVRAHGSDSLHCITNQAHALLISRLNVQRSCYVRNTYTFKIGWKYAVLEPLDIVTITDSLLGLNRKAVRIRTIEEDPVTQSLTITAEELHIGIAHAPVYTTDRGEGGGQDPSADPYLVNPPIAFVPPLTVTNGVPELWIATSGSSKDWASAQVWLSWDGSSYSYEGDVGKCRYGYLGTNVNAGALIDGVNTLDIDFSVSKGVLVSQTTVERDALTNAIWIDNEIIGWQTATLTGTNRYTISNLRRGASGTISSVHSSGVLACVLDDALFKFKIDKSRYGQTVYIKLVSYNLANHTQDVAAVIAYQFQLPPAKTVTPVVANLPFKFTFDSFIREDWESIENGNALQLSIQSGGIDGGNFIQAAGNGTIAHKTLIPVNDTQLYGLSFTGQQVTAGSSSYTIGVFLLGIAADGVTIVDKYGTNSVSYLNHSLVSLTNTSVGQWNSRIGYIKGRAPTGTTTAGNAPSTPGTFNNNVRYIRIALVFSMPSDSNGVTGIDSIELFNATADLVNIKNRTMYDTVANRTAAAGSGTYGGLTLVIGDIWFDTDANYVGWRWNGSSWQTVADGSTIVMSRIAAGSISADKIVARTLTAMQIAAGTLTANEIAAGQLKTSDYQEDINGYAIQGAKLDHTGTALKVAAGGFRLGQTLFSKFGLPVSAGFVNTNTFARTNDPNLLYPINLVSQVAYGGNPTNCIEMQFQSDINTTVSSTYWIILTSYGSNGAIIYDPVMLGWLTSGNIPYAFRFGLKSGNSWVNSPNSVACTVQWIVFLSSLY